MLYYLYYLNFARVALNVTDKRGIHLYYANKEQAVAEACVLSLSAPYPIFIDTDSALNNTRDKQTFEGLAMITKRVYPIRGCQYTLSDIANLLKLDDSPELVVEKESGDGT